MTENEKNARIFKAFCDANRLTILGLLQVVKSVRASYWKNSISDSRLITSHENIV